MMGGAIAKAEGENVNNSDTIVASLVLLYQLQVIKGDFTGEYKSHCQFARSYIEFHPNEPMNRFA